MTNFDKLFGIRRIYHNNNNYDMRDIKKTTKSIHIR